MFFCFEYHRPLALIGAPLTFVARNWSIDKVRQPPCDPSNVTLRKSANAAFKVAVAKRGILLTKADILKQYDRYNASESLDKETQLILAEILDIMENVAK